MCDVVRCFRVQCCKVSRFQVLLLQGFEVCRFAGAGGGAAKSSTGVLVKLVSHPTTE